jgi:ketosteroid isomerase-like protein
MPEEPTTPDLVERGIRLIDAINARDFDAMASFYAPDAVYDARRTVGRLEGHEAIRGFLEEFFGVYEEFEIAVDEARELGHGVVFAVFNQRARLPDTAGWVQEVFPMVSLWADGLIQQQVSYTNIDEARAAAERLVEERG